MSQFRECATRVQVAETRPFWEFIKGAKRKKTFALTLREREGEKRQGFTASLSPRAAVSPRGGGGGRHARPLAPSLVFLSFLESVRSTPHAFPERARVPQVRAQARTRRDGGRARPHLGAVLPPARGELSHHQGRGPYRGSQPPRISTHFLFLRSRITTSRLSQQGSRTIVTRTNLREREIERERRPSLGGVNSKVKNETRLVRSSVLRYSYIYPRRLSVRKLWAFAKRNKTNAERSKRKTMRTLCAKVLALISETAPKTRQNQDG